MTQLLNRDDSNFIAKEKDCKEKISDKWDTMLGPSFTAEQTYKMLDKKVRLQGGLEVQAQQ